jgi:hypothetical protein
MNNQHEKNREHFEEKSSGSPAKVYAILAFIAIWVILGVAAFIASLVCFGKEGSGLEKAVGLLLAVFFGPLYWIYFLVAKNYCR